MSSDAVEEPQNLFSGVVSAASRFSGAPHHVIEGAVTSFSLSCSTTCSAWLPAASFASHLIRYVER